MPGPNTTGEGTEWDVGVRPSGGGKDGGGNSVGGYLHYPSIEHSCTVHYEWTQYRPVSAGRATPGVNSV